MTAPLIYFIIMLLDGHWTGVYRVGHVPQFGLFSSKANNYLVLPT